MERNYSATECEALGVKEALVKFQSFIKGERGIVTTDHAVLMWAQTYENANRRLVAWGTVFRVFPGLNIVHRAGEVHLNIDPLSRLPRILLHQSPVIDGSQPIWDAISEQPIRAWESVIKEPALKATFLVTTWEEVLGSSSEDPTAWAVTRREAKEVKSKGAEEKEEDKQKEGQKGPLRPHRMPQLLWDVASLSLITGLP